MRKHFDAPVDLRPAFVYVCHDCGQENFVRAQAVVFESNEDREEAADQLGIDLDSLDSAVAGIPETVICDHCGGEFTTEVDAYRPPE